MDMFQKKLAFWRQQNASPLPPDDEVWYYAPSQVTLYTSAGVQSHIPDNQ